MTTIPDSIVKKTILKAPQSRVWRAISNEREFGMWFGAEFDSPFTAGARITGRIRPTKVDPEVAKMQEEFSGTPFEIKVEAIQPETLFSFYWHPYAVDTTKDFSKEPMTLVTFELRSVPEGTHLTITESGFDKVPLDRRAEAFTSNEGGWEHQSRLIERYVSQYAR